MYIYGLALKPERKKPMRAPVSSVTVRELEGIIGDVRGSSRGEQVGILSYEQWKEACGEINTIIPWWYRRVCVCVSGYSFGPRDVGRQICFEAGVILEITEETRPCSRMNEVMPGLRDALRNWRGGVRSNVIVGGTLAQNEKFRIM